MACPRDLDFKHNRNLPRGEWNNIKACPGIYKSVPGGRDII